MSTVFHLSPAGVPISWSVDAMYNGRYGIAHLAAESWYQKHGSMQMVLEIDRGVVKRSELFFRPEHVERQQYDRDIILQGDTFFGLDEAMVALVVECVSQKMRDVGCFISMAEWELRYPASKLMRDRWNDWHDAVRAAEEAGRRLEWEPRWSMMMEAPDDWTPTFRVTEDGLGVEPIAEGVDDPTDGHRWDDADTASNAMRSMNSGWTFEQTLVLMQPEPVEPEMAPALSGP